MSRPESAGLSPADADAQSLTVLFDRLIPGDGGHWPAFSSAVDLSSFARSSLDADTRVRALSWSEALRGLDDAGRTAFLQAREADSPAHFSALLTAAHRTYYTAPSVLAVIRAVAEAGPRETTALFDPALVQNVLARSAGKRRL